MLDGKSDVLLTSKTWFIVPFLLLLLGYSQSVFSAEGLWPNSAFSEPKQAQPLTPPQSVAQLTFRDK